jgi:hypothetical protein
MNKIPGYLDLNQDEPLLEEKWVVELKRQSAFRCHLENLYWTTMCRFYQQNAAIVPSG